MSKSFYVGRSTAAAVNAPKRFITLGILSDIMVGFIRVILGIPLLRNSPSDSIYLFTLLHFSNSVGTPIECSHEIPDNVTVDVTLLNYLWGRLRCNTVPRAFLEGIECRTLILWYHLTRIEAWSQS